MDDNDSTQVLNFNEEVSENSKGTRIKIGQLEILSEMKEILESTFPLYEGVNLIGRDKIADVSINYKALSKIHACIHINGDHYSIQDNQSHNKTFLGKRVLHPWQLYQLNGKEDIITFGDLKCKIVITRETICEDTESLTASDPGSESIIPDDDIPVDGVFHSMLSDEISSNRFYKDSNESPVHLESEPVSGCKLLGSAPLYNQSDDNLSEVFQSRQDHFSDQAPEIMIGPLLNQFAETLPLENGFLEYKSQLKVDEESPRIESNRIYLNKESNVNITGDLNLISNNFKMSQELTSQEFKFPLSAVKQYKNSTMIFDNYVSFESPTSIIQNCSDRKSLEDKPMEISNEDENVKQIHFIDNKLKSHPISLPGASSILQAVIKPTASSNYIEDSEAISDSLEYNDMEVQATQAYCLPENMEIQEELINSSSEATQPYILGPVNRNHSQSVNTQSNTTIDPLHFSSRKTSVVILDIKEKHESITKCISEVKNNELFDMSLEATQAYCMKMSQEHLGNVTDDLDLFDDDDDNDDTEENNNDDENGAKVSKQEDCVIQRLSKEKKTPVRKSSRSVSKTVRFIETLDKKSCSREILKSKKEKRKSINLKKENHSLEEEKGRIRKKNGKKSPSSTEILFKKENDHITDKKAVTKEKSQKKLLASNEINFKKETVEEEEEKEPITIKKETKKSRNVKPKYFSDIEQKNMAKFKTEKQKETDSTDATLNVLDSVKPIIKRKSLEVDESENKIPCKIRTKNSNNKVLPSSKIDASYCVSKSLGKRQNSYLRPKVVFTGITDKQVEKIVTELGGELVDNVALATHLVTDKVRRTVKFLCAVARGIPIVSLEWLNAGKSASMFVSCENHMLHDNEAEQLYSFQLVHSLETAARTRLFENANIYVTKNVKPEPKAMKEMIEFSGGKFLLKAPTKFSSNTYIVSCNEDLKEIYRLEKLNYKILSNEFILTGILQQKFATEKFLLETSSSAR